MSLNNQFEDFKAAQTDVQSQSPMVSIADLKEFMSNQKLSVAPLHHMNENLPNLAFSAGSDKSSTSASDDSSSSWLTKVVRQAETACAADLLKSGDVAGLQKLIRNMWGNDEAIGNLQKSLSKEGIDVSFTKNSMTISYQQPGRDTKRDSLAIEFDKDGNVQKASMVKSGGFAGAAPTEVALKPEQVAEKLKDLLERNRK
jgi:hypothetical protein